MDFASMMSNFESESLEKKRRAEELAMQKLQAQEEEEYLRAQ